MRTLSRLSYPYALATLSLALLLTACGGGDVSLPPDGQPGSIEVVDGDDQSGRVGEPLAEPLVVQVTDSRGRPVQGATVAFEFNSAGAGASVVPQEKITNGDGMADARLVLGTTVGLQTGRARVVAAEETTPVQTSFSAIAMSENANSMAAAAGQDQTGHVGQPLDDRLVVEVTDGFGNPVAGVPITWAVEGGGSVSQEVVETDEDGRSRVERILGPMVGQQTTLASAEGLAGSPVVFVHTAVAGDASRLTVVSGADQTGEAGTLLPAELVVRLVDAQGNGVPNTAVAWVVATGGGSPSPNSSTTDGDGYASTQWTLGEALGEQRLDAVVSGVGFVSFRATATAGAPASLFIHTQPSPSAGNGIRLQRQPVIQLRDARGNEVAAAGVQVTAELNGGGELEGTIRRTTDASGRAAFDDLAISGAPGTRTLVFSAVGYASVTSSEIDLQAIGTTTTITADSPDPSQVGTAVTVSFRVTSAGPTPTGNVTVSDGVQSCSGGLSNGEGSCSLTLTTEGQRTLTATYGGGPGLTGSSDTESHTVTAVPPPPPPPPPSNQPPTAAFTAECDELECDFEDESNDPDGRIESRGWEFGDGATSDDRNPDHEYSSSGTYTVRLTVTDNDGATATLTRDVTVTEEAASTNTRFEVDSPDPTVPGQPFTVTLSVRSDDGTPEGTAIVTDGVDSCNVPIAGGSGSCTLALSTVGERTLTATFQGNASFATSSANETHTVNPPPAAATTTTITGDSPDPSEVGQQITVSFTVTASSGSPDGTVQVAADGGGGSCSATVAQGSCLLTPGNGTTTITATYQGSSSFAGSSDTESHTVNPAPPAATTTTITGDSPDPSEIGQQITVSFTVTSSSGSPDGTVQVTADGGGSCSATVAEGSCPLTPGNGTTTITATYQGSSSFAGSSDTEPHTVNPQASGRLGIETQPSDEAEEDEAFDRQPIIQVLDGSGGNLALAGVRVSAEIGPGSDDGELRGTTDSTTDGAGRAIFTNLAIDDEGDYRLRFSADGFESVTSEEIEVDD